MSDRGEHEPTQQPTHVDEGEIHAWLDGALSPGESAAVETHIASCAQCCAATAEARGLIAASTRILSALDDVPGGVIPTTTPAPRRRGWPARRFLPLAAAAIGMFAVGAVVLRLGAPAREHPSPTEPAAVLPRPVAATAQVATVPAPAAPSTKRATAAVPHEIRKSGIPEAARLKVAAMDQPSTSQQERSKAMASNAAEGVSADAASDSVARNSIGAVRLFARTRTAAVLAQAAPRQHTMTAESNAAPFAAPSTAISGRIVDASTGRPLLGANIAVAGSGVGVTTDTTGDFIIPGMTPGHHTLTARHIGFVATSTQVTVGPDQPPSITVVLQPQSSQLLEQVIVTGSTATKVSPFTSAPPVIEGASLLSSNVSQERGTTVRRSVYETRPGVRVVLAETRAALVEQLRDASGTTLDTRSAQRRMSLRDSQPLKIVPAQGAAQSIHWTAKDGTAMVLSGELTPAELEAIKQHIVH